MCERRDSALNFPGILLRIAHIDRAHLDTKGWGYRLDCPELTRPRCCIEVAENPCSFNPGRDVLEQFQPLAGHAIFEVGKPSGVAARVGQTIYETATDWISDLDEYHRNTASRLQQRPSGWTSTGQNNVGSEREQFARIFADTFGIPCTPADRDSRVAPL